jgi:hypothetical protein
MSTRLKVKVNFSFANFKEGQEFEIACDEEGTPVDNYWFNRLKDSKTDNCISVIETIGFILKKPAAEKHAPLQEQKTKGVS